MIVSHLAAPNVAFQMGYLILALGVPTVGWILLIIGLRQRSRSRPQPHIRPEYRATPRRGAPSGSKLIVIGAVLLAIGAIAVVARLATAA